MINTMIEGIILTIVIFGLIIYGWSKTRSSNPKPYNPSKGGGGSNSGDVIDAPHQDPRYNEPIDRPKSPKNML